MAKQASPETVGERAMFASPEAAPVAFPVPRPDPRPLARASLDLPEVLEDLPVSFKPTLREQMRSPAAAVLRARQLLPTRPAVARAVRRAVALEIDRGIAFLLAPVLLSAGALAYFSLNREPAFLSLMGSAALLAVSAFLARARQTLHMMLLAILLCVVGALLAKAETWRAGTKMLGGEITTQLSGRVAEAERMADGRVRLTIDVTGTARPVLRHAPERVRVSARQVPPGVTAGSEVTGLVRLMSPSGPVRPGSYDFSFESYFDRIGASGFFLRGPEPMAGTEPVPAIMRFRAAVERFRHAVAQRISSSIGGAEGEIAAALVVGVRAGIPEEVNEALRRAGIYHIISISGLHMALVAGTIMLILRSGFALFPEFSSRYPVKKYAAALALVGLASYLFISGAEVAAQRSFIMLAVMLVAVLFDRAALTLRNLAMSAIIVIALSPHEVVGPSFQMSFAATAALVGAYAAWSDWRMDRPGRAPAEGIVGRIRRYLLVAMGGLAATSFVAGGATAIYAAWHFQQMPSLGLLTNLTAMPVVSGVVMPFAVLGALAMPFGIDAPFFQVMGLGLSVTIAIATWFAERTTADIVGLVSPAAVFILTLALLIATVSSTWLRMAAVPAAIVGMLFLVLDRPRPTLFVSEDGRLVGLDMGSGLVAVNRSRPNEFTVDNWKRAMRAGDVLRPDGRQERTVAAASGEPRGGRVPGSGSVDHGSEEIAGQGARHGGNGHAGTVSPATDSRTGRKLAVSVSALTAEQRDASGRTAPEKGFTCAEGLCLARHPSGAVVAHALDAAAALDACATATVLVVEDASTKDICRWKDVFVVTGRELALYGSAAITLASVPLSSDSGPARRAAGLKASSSIAFAISRPYRPWHDQRRFSRAARGLPPYQPKQKRQPATGTSGQPYSVQQPKSE